MEYKIVVDSCGEFTQEMKNDERFESVPLTMQVGDEEIVDNADFDQASFLKKIAECPQCPKSACPSPEYYRKAYDCDADRIYAVTLSAELSGSYNSATLGMNLFLENHKGKKGHVFNSCGASVGEALIALKIKELEERGLAFDEVVKQTDSYVNDQNLFFVLDNLETLRKNGRLSTVKAMVASALKIKPVMTASKEGVICQLDQARGINKALVKMVDAIVAATEDSANRILGISHCNCLERAQMVRDAILERMEVKDVILLDTAGISSMYANEGGIIVAI